MKIDKFLIQLYEIYKKPFSQTTDFFKAFSEALQFIEDELGGFFDWDTLSKTEPANKELLELLKLCIVPNQNGELIFDYLDAKAKILSQQQTVGLKKLHLSHHIETSGIQEKYLKSQLTSHEQLTPLDMKRFISNTGMQDAIQVVNLDEESIGLILHNLHTAHENSSEPYSIALMVNLTNQDEPTSTQWISLRIKINPNEFSVDYQAKSESKLTELEKDKITQAIENAIKFNKTSPFGKEFTAFPQYQINKMLSFDNTKKIDSYKLLHELYKDETLNQHIAKNTDAQEFASISDSQAIMKKVYEIQLKAIHISPEQAANLEQQVKDNFEEGGIKRQELQKQLELLTFPIANAVSQNPLVSKQLSEIRLYNKKITFPKETSTPKLTSVDYLHFLLLVNQKFQHSGLNTALDEMIINCYDEAALEGLIAFSTANQNQTFQTLTLNIDELDLSSLDKQARFLFNLKTMLLSMSDTDLAALKFIDNKNQFTIDMIENLKNFICARPVTININLPTNYQSSIEQQLIDEAVSDHIRDKNISAFGKDSRNKDYQIIKQTIKTRSKTKKQNLSIDIELQQEQQAEIANETQANKSEDGGELEPGNPILYTMQEFQSALSKGLLDINSKSYLVDSNFESVKSLWLNWTGSLRLPLSKGLKLSKTACEELLRHKDKFQFGLDLNNLPPGFILKQDDEVKYIHFDENRKLLAEYDPLQVQTTKISSEKPLPNTLFKKWLESVADTHIIKNAWNILTQKAYNKEAHQTFQAFLPQMLSLSEGQLKSLFKLCFDESNNFDSKKLRFLLENAAKIKEILSVKPTDTNINKVLTDLFIHKKADANRFILNYTQETPSFAEHLLNSLLGDNESLRQKIQNFIVIVPDISLNGLLQLYAKLGEKGIDEIIKLANSEIDLFKHLNTQIFSHTATYASLLTDEYKDALNAIKSFSENEKIWWNTLLQQHCEAQKNVNLVDLVNAFKEFNKKLKEIPTPDGKALELPPTCDLKEIKSLPVTLSRMLTILKHCKEQDRAQQLRILSKLDLSSRGAINLTTITGKSQWAFISPEMNINPAYEINTNNHSDSTYKPIYTWQNIQDENIEKLRENFFRFVAFQKRNGQMPFKFYDDARQALDTSDLSKDILKILYPIIAASSINIEQTQESAKKQLKSIIKLIHDTPIPLLPETLKERSRYTILNLIQELDSIPTLPILSQLLSFISSTLSGGKLWNVPKLKQTNQNLRDHIQTYGSSVYEGMKAYNSEDFKDSELFFNYIKILSAIENSFPNNRSDAKNIINLISTFRLTKDDIVKLKSFFEHQQPFTEEQKQRFDLTFYLLKNLSVNPDQSLRKLESRDLIDILETIKNDERPVKIVLQELILHDGKPLKAYFPENLLENYSETEISEEIKAKIKSKFNEKQQKQILSFLNKFSGPTQSSSFYGQLVDRIIAICEPLDMIEKNIFIQKLTGSIGFYINPKELEKENNLFIELLDTIIANNSPDDLINIVASEQHLYKSSTETQKQTFFQFDGDKPYISDLSYRTLLYMQSILPAIKGLDNLVISETDLTPRLHSVLLRTPANQLTQNTTIESENKELFEEQETLLKTIQENIKTGKRIDFSQVETSINTFIHTVNLSKETNESFEGFRTLLNEIRKPKKISLKDSQAMLKNPLLILLVLYLTTPEKMPQKQRSLFEQRYKQKLEAKIKDYPGIVENQELLSCLFKNPEFFQQLIEKSVLTAAGSPRLLEDDEKLSTVLDALSKDLDKVAEFKRKTEQVNQAFLQEKANLSKYPNVFVALYKKINAIASANPNSKKQFLELYDRYLENYSPEKDGELLKYLNDFVSILEKSFANITDKNMVLSLCLQFNSETNKELQPEKLLKLLEKAQIVAPHQSTVLKIAVALINNDKDYSFEEFSKLCDQVKSHQEFADALAQIYEKAPFPTISQVLEWHQESNEKPNYAESMLKLYNAYNINPCKRELKDLSGNPLNGFHLEVAEKKLAQFKGLEGLGDKQIDLKSFKQKTDEMRTKTSKELLKILASYNPKHESYNDQNAQDVETLVAAAAELFHRSKGKDSLRPGSSMEINTTQYLAILTSLKTPGHVTSQIGTGEGKSRIMMISIACQFAQGKTVDFVTSDAQLATRDFVEYQAYFEMIGAETSMIFAHTDPSLYKIGGVNFSDPSNLSLFRNKARSTGREEQVIDPTEENRCLLLDEADKTYFDVADTRFNFSQEADEMIRGMEWVYPLLMEYFAQEKTGKKISPIDLYYDDVDESREDFLIFASKYCTKTNLMRLKALSNAQIEQWQVSAVTASELKFREDFDIEPDVLISTPKGPKISSEAQVRFASRVSKSSKFSFGLHQCLHARLNLAKNNLDTVKDQNLKVELEKCNHAFYIQDEKQIIYSSTSKNLLDDYAKGTLKAVTGTSGSIIEREEARQLYGLLDENSTNQMHFIDVPRDRGMHRRDRAINLRKNAEQQFKAIIEQIKLAREKKQPILIITENDEESHRLFTKLAEKLKNDPKLQRIHSKLSPKEEKTLIDKAGDAGQITVSTDMIGRGTDISLNEQAKSHGLNVIVTYLPSSRDLEQIIGRSGRFGAKGETSLIIDKERLKRQLGKKTLTDGFYKNREQYILQQQTLMDRKKQCKRLIKNTVGDFRMSLTKAFFKEMLKQTEAKDYNELLTIWTTFFSKTDMAWNEIWPHIQEDLDQETVNIDAVKNKLSQYEAIVQKEWNNLRGSLSNTSAQCLDGQRPIDKIPKKITPLILSKPTERLLQSFNIKLDSMDKWMVYDYYDPAHSGRAVKYSHWSIPFIASLKGYANLIPFVNFSDARPPFANFRAWLAGHGQLFPELRASKNKGKIIGVTILSLLGAGIGAALIATGVLAPLGLAVLGLSSFATSILIGTTVGLSVGAILGTAIGAIIDRKKASAQPPKRDINPTFVASSEHFIENSAEVILRHIPPGPKQSSTNAATAEQEITGHTSNSENEIDISRDVQDNDALVPRHKK